MNESHPENRRQTIKSCEGLFRFCAAKRRKSVTVSASLNDKVVTLYVD